MNDWNFLNVLNACLGALVNSPVDHLRGSSTLNLCIGCRLFEKDIWLLLGLFLQGLERAQD